MSETSEPSQFRIKLGVPTAPQGVPTPDDAPDLEISKVSKDPEEMKFRIRELPFPSESTYLWRSAEERPAAPPFVPVVVAQDVLRAANAHVSQSDEYEIGGFLLGNRCRCPNTGVEYIIIDQVTEARHTQATPTSLKFTTETWSQLKDDLSGKFVGKLCLGWYHSHPKMDVFLSGYDEVIQKTYFSELWNSALVIEPTKRRGGFFCWRPDGMNLSTPDQFYELLERNSDATVVDWTNYECVEQRTGEVITPPRAEPPAPIAAESEEAAGGSVLGWPASAAIREERLRGGRPPVALILAGVAILALVVAVTFLLTRQGTVLEEPPTTQATPEDKSAVGINVVDESVEKQVLLPESLSISMTLIGPLTDPKIEVDGREAEIKKVVETADSVDVKAVAKLGDKIAKLRQGQSTAERVQIKVVDRQKAESGTLTFYLTLGPSDVASQIVNTNRQPKGTPTPHHGRPPKQNDNAKQQTPSPTVSPAPVVVASPQASTSLTTQPSATPANPTPSATPSSAKPPQPQPTPSKEEKDQLKKSQKDKESRLEDNHEAQRALLKYEKEQRLRQASGEDERRRIKKYFDEKERTLKASQVTEKGDLQARHKVERERLKGEH